MDDFKSFGLPKDLLQTLIQLGFKQPTPIQQQAIPAALDGHDILGTAQTGTGKTGAFGIPLIKKLTEQHDAQALVITPTRELATQVLKAFHDFLGKGSKIKTALLIGGEHIGKQFSALKRRPNIIVGTPGRINDHLDRRSLKLDRVEMLVLDETDRMLDMGFSVQIEAIMQHIPKHPQTLLFSATLPKNIMQLANRYLVEPKRIAVGSTFAPAKNIKQDLVHVKEADKYSQLTLQLDEREGSIVVFVKTKFGAERIAKKLRQEEYLADAIHGDLRHNKRERVIKGFRNKRHRILVATDIAARGLDIPHVRHVINYDLPQCPEDYIHRIGRTARAGMDGEACCFITPGDKRRWYAIDKLMNPDTAVKPEGRKPSAKQNKKKSNAAKPSFKHKAKSGKGKFSSENASSSQSSSGQFSSDKPAFGKRSAGKADARKSSSDTPSFGKYSANRSGSGKLSAGKPSFRGKPKAKRSEARKAT